MPKCALAGFLRVGIIVALAVGAPVAMACWQSRSVSAALAARAVETGDDQMLRRQLDLGVDPNLSPGGVPLLHVAAVRGDVVAIRLLLEHGADVDRRDAIRRTALHAAVGAGQTDAVCELLRAGADVNARASRGRTPLFFAVSSGKGQLASLLVQHGADSHRTIDAECRGRGADQAACRGWISADPSATR